MKVIVISKNESVIYDGKIFKLNDTFEADDAIAASLIERGYVAEAIAPVPVEGEVEDPAPSVTDEADEADSIEESDGLEEASYTELKKLAASMGLPSNGKRVELIARIRAAGETEDTEAELPNTAMPE